MSNGVKVKVLRRHRADRAWYEPGIEYELTRRAAADRETAGLVVRVDGKSVSGPSKNAALSGPSETAAQEPKWPLKMEPSEYLEKYQDESDPSDAVAERMALARKLVEAEDE